MRMRKLGLSLLLFGTHWAAPACSALTPEVGPLVDASAAPPPAATCTVGSSGYGTSYGSPSGQAATTDFCSEDGGTIQGPCDVCEAKSCCAQRVACYSEEACSCADEALDSCTSADSPDASTALTACWTAFAGTDAVAEARYACLKTWCAGVCEIPN